jgi:hypothetical protein
MKITSKTLLEDLYRANIIDINTYLHLHGEKYTYVNDVLMLSFDSDSWSSQTREDKELSTFLYGHYYFF